MKVFNQEGLILRIYVREEDRFEGKPLYKKILELAKDKGPAGATILGPLWDMGPQEK